LKICKNNEISGNTANNNNRRGVFLDHSDDIQVIGNILNGNGWYPYAYDEGTNIDFLWNLEDGSTDPIVFDDSGGGDFTWAEASNQLAWITGSGTSITPYVIDNIIIDGQNLGSCIEISSSNAYLIIRNSEFSNSGSGTSDAGIKLVSVSAPSTELTNNDCSDNNGYGI